jgi:RNase H-fold protein (predicted Holliday junction resolvase)
MNVLGIDPGTRKVGFALVTDAQSAPVALGIVPLETLGACLDPLLQAHPIRAIALGEGTNVAAVLAILERFGTPIHRVDETGTTYAARALYFADHPPKGWKRLLPLGLQLPPRPIDDYAALLIARRFLTEGM